MSNVAKFLNKYKRQIGEGVFSSLTAGSIGAGFAYQGGEGDLLPSFVGGAVLGLTAASIPRYGIGAIRKKVKTDALLSSKAYQGFGDDITKQKDRIDVLRKELDAISLESRKNQQYEIFRNARIAKGVRDLPPTLSALDDSIAAMRKRQQSLYTTKGKAIKKSRKLESRIQSKKSDLRTQQKVYENKLVQDLLQKNKGLKPHEARLIAEPEAKDAFSVIRKTIVGTPRRDMALVRPTIPYKTHQGATIEKEFFDFTPVSATGLPAKVPGTPSPKRVFTPYFRNPAPQQTPGGVDFGVIPHSSRMRPSNYGGGYATEGGGMVLNPNLKMIATRTTKVGDMTVSKVKLRAGQFRRSPPIGPIQTPTYADFLAAQRSQGLGHQLAHAEGSVIKADKSLERLKSRLERYSKIQRNIPAQAKEELRQLRKGINDAQDAVKKLQDDRQAFLDQRSKSIADSIDNSFLGLGGFGV